MTDPKEKPVLNEQTFEKLLEAGYVIQEHGRKMHELEVRMESHSERLREQEAANQASLQSLAPNGKETSRSDGDYTLTLAEIVEAQRQIQARKLDLEKAMAVIAEKVARIAGATGAGIGLLVGKAVRYRAGAGEPALPEGSEVPLNKAICAASVRTGQVIRSDDVNTEVLFDPEPCRERGILSLVAVPIYHDGDIVGALELYFDRIHGYAEQDIHTCQLMAGLVTEAIGRDAESKLKNSMAEERSTMLAAIEKLTPNLAALAGDQSSVGNAIANPHTTTADKAACWKCGNILLAQEQFCGKCGAPRDNESEPSSMQSKLASAWHKQQRNQEPATDAPLNGNSHSQNKTEPAPADRRIPSPAGEDGELLTVKTGKPLSELSSTASAGEIPEIDSQQSELQAEEEILDTEQSGVSSAALVKQSKEAVVWSSAAKARDFLESLAGTKTPSVVARFWQSRRGDFYLAVAVILVIVVIRWGLWSNHPVGATTHTPALSGSANGSKSSSADSDLSTFDKIMIGLGLAEPPDAPENKGNPETQVWIDVHTALYYCPGSDLYQKTPGGRVSSQRNAQLDQFEPANRKPCE